MNADCTEWLKYADENLAVATIALDGGYYNACLQNVQQAVEKYLKAALLCRNLSFTKTHSIAKLFRQLCEINVYKGLAEDDCEFLDSIYVPTKYPLGGVLPDFCPDSTIGRQCVEIGEQVKDAIWNEVGGG
jgi:HEPN domain-containing protein